MEEGIVDIGEKLKMSFKNDYSILSCTSADRWLPHLLLVALSNSPTGELRRAMILFFFSFQTDCVALGLWGTSGMKLWSGKLIMPPCMAELVNTKLSLSRILPWGRKASQIPYHFLFALRVEAVWSLPV